MANLLISDARLTEIGDELRLHFGEYKSEGFDVENTPSPFIWKTGNCDDEEGNQTPGVSDFAMDPTLMPYTFSTFQAPGAVKLMVDMYYQTEDWEYEPSWLWFAPGLHENVNLLVEPVLKYVGWNRTEIPGYYDENEEWVEGEKGPTMANKQYEINGDSFSFAVWAYQKNYHTRYYMKIYAIDEAGNLMSGYTRTMNKIRNKFSLSEIPLAISKLNNYPVGEGVKF